MFINLTSLTSLHQPTNERNLPQRQVALHDIGHKEQQQNGTVRHTQVNIFYRDIFGSQIEYCRKQHITTDSLQVILNGILLLPYEIGQKHGDRHSHRILPRHKPYSCIGNQVRSSLPVPCNLSGRNKRPNASRQSACTRRKD